MTTKGTKPEAAQWPFPAKGSPAWKAAQIEAAKEKVIDSTSTSSDQASTKATNPDWTRDELILALNLYFSVPGARGSKTHPECIKLSEVLNSLPVHQDKPHGVTFRNANGVGMKLSNFLKYDPAYKGVGLTAGSRLEEEVWDTFSGDKARLKAAAAAILAGATELSEMEISVDQFDEDEEAEEGRILTAIHRRRERQPGLAKKKKQQVLSRTGALKCEVCSFDFALRYGKVGEGFAECHHGRPISTLKAGDKTKLSELHIICANCHRMIHRERPWLSVEQFKARYSKTGT
jgi:5-methylcytosine-specific restriction protein A